MAEPVFSELKRYVRFSDADQVLLKALAPHVMPERARIADAFYARLREHESARRIFADDAQIDRQKGRLIEWMGLLVNGPWDDVYAALRARIGQRHVEIELPQRFMFGAMALIRAELDAIARRAFRGDEAVLEPTLTALHKLLDLELALMLESYAEEHIAEVKRSERLEAALEKERLAERTRRAESLASLGTMAAGLAHEVRNPLNAAQLQLQLLHRRLGRTAGPDIAGARGAADLVATELNRLAQLVDEVLQFARPQQLRRLKVDLCETVRTIIQLAAPDAEKRGVRVSISCADHVVAELDEERIKQVLHNLLRNAVEACETQGGGKVTVRVECRDGDSVLEIEDDGPGLPDPKAPIFEPFFTTKSNGTGLGLTLVHRIVTDHGGTISCDSRPGRTLFAVVLPSGRGGAELAHSVADIK
jgi:two-component system sensor histidine kinase HydH